MGRAVNNRTTGSGWVNKLAFDRPAAGELQMGPFGLGLLVEGNYLGDARTFYCPSAGGAMPVDQVRWDDSGTPSRKAATGPQDLQRAGGFDHESIAHGDWTWLPQWDSGSFPGLAVQCDYAYRNIPINVGGGWSDLVASGEDLPTTGIGSPPGAYAWMSPNPVRFWIGYTKPLVKTAIGCPAFKTQKLLGGRSLVADTFSWHNPDQRYLRVEDGGNDFYGTGYSMKPGYGIYAHRDGYNVLYGDWSAKWYGDPRKRILWPKYVAVQNDEGAYRGRSNNYANIRYNLTRTGNKHKSCSHVEWNVFDMANGIDVHSNSAEDGSAP